MYKIDHFTRGERQKIASEEGAITSDKIQGPEGPGTAPKAQPPVGVRHPQSPAKAALSADRPGEGGDWGEKAANRTAEARHFPRPAFSGGSVGGLRWEAWDGAPTVTAWRAEVDTFARSRTLAAVVVLNARGRASLVVRIESLGAVEACVHEAEARKVRTPEDARNWAETAVKTFLRRSARGRPQAAEMAIDDVSTNGGRQRGEAGPDARVSVRRDGQSARRPVGLRGKHLRRGGLGDSGPEMTGAIYRAGAAPAASEASAPGDRAARLVNHCIVAQDMPVTGVETANPAEGLPGVPDHSTIHDIHDKEFIKLFFRPHLFHVERLI